MAEPVGVEMAINANDSKLTRNVVMIYIT